MQINLIKKVLRRHRPNNKRERQREWWSKQQTLSWKRQSFVPRLADSLGRKGQQVTGKEILLEQAPCSLGLSGRVSHH